MVDLVEFHKVEATSKGRSTFGRQSCGKNHHFRQVDQVEHVQLWWQCRPQLCRQFVQTDGWQSWNAVTRRLDDQVAHKYTYELSFHSCSTKLNELATVDFRQKSNKSVTLSKLTKSNHTWSTLTVSKSTLSPVCTSVYHYPALVAVNLGHVAHCCDEHFRNRWFTHPSLIWPPQSGWFTGKCHMKFCLLKLQSLAIWQWKLHDPTFICLEPVPGRQTDRHKQADRQADTDRDSLWLRWTMLRYVMPQAWALNSEWRQRHLFDEMCSAYTLLHITDSMYILPSS